ncbi:MAG: protein kinase, partial [Sandaracinaceae bacterium]|nr:protein kinase [Sandaracinaceae bacterium]
MDAWAWLERRVRRGDALGPGVHRSHDRLRGEPVVLKEARAPRAIAALRREVAEASRGHPALRRVIGFAHEADRAALALEHVEGVELTAHLSRAPEDALTLARQLLSLLVHLHHHDLVHGDLKPANVLVERTAGGPRARVIDLGLATRIGAPLEGGTPGFLAPEALRGAPASVASDLYALGQTLARAVRAPPPALAALIDACTASAPDARPASADGALARIGALPLPLDREGVLPRQGDDAPLGALRAAAAARDGHSVVVYAAPHGGRTRLCADAVRDAMRAARPIADVRFAGGADPLGALAAVLEVPPLEPLRRAAMTGARAAELGLVVTVDDADHAGPAAREALVTFARALAERRCGALAVVGADAALGAALVAVGAHALTLA